MSAAQLEAFRASEAGTVKIPYLMIAALFVVVAVLIQLAHLPEVKEAAAEGKVQARLRLQGACFLIRIS